MDWYPIHGGCNNMVVMSYSLNKDQFWWNELLGLIRSTLNSSQVADPARACPGVLGLNWYVPEWDASPLQGCPSAFHWFSLTICCYPFILFGGTFNPESKCTGIRLPFLGLLLYLIFLYWNCFCYFSTDTRMCWIIRMGNYHQNVLQISTG